MRYWKDEKLKKWYAKRLLKQLEGKAPIRKSSDPILDTLYKEMLTLTEENLCDILLEERRRLTEKYVWIREYVKLCDFIAYYSELQELTKKKKEYASLRTKYLNQYMGYYLTELIAGLSMKEPELTRSWKNFNRLWQNAVHCCEEMNRIISTVVDYSFMSQEMRHQLYQKMDVQICPYCNRQYIHTVSMTEEGMYLGDLDHFYPKSIYQLFSLSLWNLTPVCKPCNQLFKRQYNRRILSPMTVGFENDCILKINYADAGSIVGMNDHFTFGWEIQADASEDKKLKIQQNLDMFYLNDVYQFHKQDIQDILRKRYLRSNVLIEKQNELLGSLRLSAEDVNRMVYGTTLSRERFHKELLGKMTYDIAKFS